jgi:hypothetical protein
VGQERAGPKQVDLARTDRRTDHDWPIWAIDPVAVPQGAILRFKLYYWVGDERFKDDNDGVYYLTVKTEEHIPPPPLELARAAQEWADRLTARGRG